MPDKKYTLSQPTYNELKRLIDKKDGISPLGRGFQSVHRPSGFVLCGSEISTGKYNGTRKIYSAYDDTWIDDTYGPCVLIAPNGGKLIEGKRFKAELYGVDGDGKTVWVATHEYKCVELVTDIVCTDGVMEVTKECFWICGEIKSMYDSETCCGPGE